MKNTDSSQVVCATLEKPIPVVGLHEQELGVVRQCSMLLDEGVVAELELQTSWQKIKIDRNALRYDADREVFQLLRREALAASD